MIQDIGQHIYHNEYSPREPKPGDILFVFQNGKIQCNVGPDGNLYFPKVEESTEPVQFLFTIDDTAFFLGSRPIPGYELENIRTLRHCEPSYLGFAGMTAWHLYVWYSSHRFCGKCGAPTRHHEKLRAMECPDCGNLMFPVIAPAVIVAVTKGDEILITRYAGREHKGIALIAGFCEIGERAEDTVHREVMEEAGVKVKNLRYFATQPWGFASNLLLGFFCQLDGSDEIHMDEEELQFAQWVKREDLPEPESLASLTATMIELFRQGKENGPWTL